MVKHPGVRIPLSLHKIKDMDGGLGDAVGKMLMTLLVLAVVGVVGVIGLGGYAVADYFWMDEVYEVAAPIKPEIKLTTDGAKIDTVYVYRFE